MIGAPFGGRDLCPTLSCRRPPYSQMSGLGVKRD